jgi:subtilisin family serine protease
MREPFREEVFWLMAAEWADEKGAHIISSSLGYGYQRYFLKDMDGKTSLVAKAAAKAVSKGILVINSAGNEGTDPWKLIITPADQDSVLAVGGVDPRSGYHIDFSSYGPNYLGHVKPNLCAPGDVMAARGMKIGNIQGTSFSCPLMAGFAACLLQFKPELIGKPIQSMRFLEEHSSLYPYFDYAHGYGVPDVNYILEGKRNTGNAALSLKDEGAKKSINIHFEETSADPYLINEWKHSLYVKFLDENGKVISYQLYEVKSDMKEIDVSYQRVENVFAVEAHYAGVTKKLILNHYAH